MQWYVVTFVVRRGDMAMIHQKTKPSCHLNWTLGRNNFQLSTKTGLQNGCHNYRPGGVTTASQHNWWHNRFHITTGGTRIIDPVPDSFSTNHGGSCLNHQPTTNPIVDQVLTGHSKRSCSSSWTSWWGWGKSTAKIYAQIQVIFSRFMLGSKKPTHTHNSDSM